jgi:predicted AAA+ superfamily ATPase
MSLELSYISRISDEELKRKLNASGALLIRGMKACGKTQSAKQLAANIISFDQDEQVSLLMETAPARNVATTVDITVLEKDVKLNENTDVSRPTIYDYLEALNRLMIIEDQPAWNKHIRSSATLRKSGKRHFSDVALAVASLGIGKEALINDLKLTGFLFESLVVHDLRVYAQANDAKVYHYYESTGLEVDAIVQKYSGEYCAFEIKLGIGQIDDAAKNLLKFASIIQESSTTKLQSLNVITGTGISYVRKDGVNVISLASLGY